jgi:formate C-acetyltransferase
VEDLAKAIESNFEGYDDLRKQLLAAPKYGNNDDYVDTFAEDLWRHFANTTRSLKNYRGGYCDPAVQMVQAHIGFGGMTGATPNGRLAGEPLADTMSATQQADVNGPTYAAKSYGKLDYPIYSNGTLLNMWISHAELIKD